jgi:hypothetical protein
MPTVCSSLPGKFKVLDKNWASGFRNQDYFERVSINHIVPASFHSKIFRKKYFYDNLLVLANSHFALIRNIELEPISAIELKFDEEIEIDETVFNLFENDYRSFEISLWNEVSTLLYEGKEDEALLKLFSKLNDELNSPQNCNAFLVYVTHLKMGSDLIVHILSALAPIKLKLANWDNFVEISRLNLIEEVGEDTAKILLNSIL